MLHLGQDGLLAEGYVAKISMLRLNIGSGMLRLSSYMLSIGLGPKCEQGKGLKLRWTSPFETKLKIDIPNFNMLAWSDLG